MIKAGVVGATGYTARYLFDILLRHPDVKVVKATSRQDAGSVADQHPSLLNQIDLQISSFEVADFVKSGIDCAFSCLPHAASAETATQLLENGIRVIDFSADYRLNDWQTFEQWYNVEHPDRDRVGKVPYGLPELFRKDLVGQSLIANPGCFPTTAILGLAPLIQENLVHFDDIIVDSKTGISGAGRSPKPHLHFPECNDSIAAYGVGNHRHGPEIEQIIQRKTGHTISVVFTPHLAPMDRGILSTIYVLPRDGVTAETATQCLRDYYLQEPFIRIGNELRSTKHVSGTNFCDITIKQSGKRIVIISAIDNLIKGASGAAVQNFNLMFGLTETRGLLD